MSPWLLVVFSLVAGRVEARLPMRDADHCTAEAQRRAEAWGARDRAFICQPRTGVEVSP